MFDLVCGSGGELSDSIKMLDGLIHAIGSRNALGSGASQLEFAGQRGVSMYLDVEMDRLWKFDGAPSCDDSTRWTQR
jgi:hypothetical protein